MKKFLFIPLVALLVAACNSNEKKEDDASQKSADMKALYEKNLATLKQGIAAFEKGDLDGWAATIADTAQWQSPAYGDTVHTKAHWRESLKFYEDNWHDLKLNNAIFLPGLDTATQEMDGSVRYYGSWDGTHNATSNKTSLLFYGTYDFNKDNKVISGADYFDAGGLMNAVTPKK